MFKFVPDGGIEKKNYVQVLAFYSRCTLLSATPTRVGLGKIIMRDFVTAKSSPKSKRPTHTKERRKIIP